MNAETQEFRISVHGLTLDMFVARLDRPWIGTGFPLEGLKITSDDQIFQLQRLCAFVHVDVSRGRSPDLRYVSFNDDAMMRHARGEDEIEALRRTRWVPTTGFDTELGDATQAHVRLQAGINAVMDDLHNGGKLDLDKLSEGIDTLVDSITRNPSAVPWILELRRKSDYSYQHALGCSVWAATFGRHLGLEKEQLRDLAMGGLLCDIGKVRLPDELLARQGRLSDADWSLLHSHVTESSRIVEDTPGLSAGVIEMVAHHHERHDGSGYPRGLRGTQIPIFARIIGLIDSYDAMTSTRPHAPSRAPHEVIMELYQCRDTLFQAELVEQFIRTSGIYPTGSLVELSDGTVGVVMSVHSLKRLRPCVLLLLDADKRPLPEFRTIDLSQIEEDVQQRPLSIKGSLPRGAYGVDPAQLFLD
ncbi:HD-GYP domain-containing protein [Lysobacter koreensis]|uniref:HD-GYP domain-containing protein n=1 Tax=Lysobacter koreensis TaxID=266122 RepID=A0ABW2YLB7_9GAMM